MINKLLRLPYYYVTKIPVKFAIFLLLRFNTQLNPTRQFPAITRAKLAHNLSASLTINFQRPNFFHLPTVCGRVAVLQKIRDGCSAAKSLSSFQGLGVTCVRASVNLLGSGSRGREKQLW